jgi:hypothetical protein
MMIAIPAEHWRVFATMTAAQLAEVLRELASKVRLGRYQKHPRGPKKPPVKRRYSNWLSGNNLPIVRAPRADQLPIVYGLSIHNHW